MKKRVIGIVIGILILGIVVFAGINNPQLSPRKDSSRLMDLDGKNIKIDGTKIIYTVNTKGDFDNAEKQLIKELDDIGLKGSPYENLLEEIPSILESEGWKSYKNYLYDVAKGKFDGEFKEYVDDSKVGICVSGGDSGCGIQGIGQCFDLCVSGDIDWRIEDILHGEGPRSVSVRVDWWPDSWN
tara:strand:+ start:11 stop:562 length:552 start_codon:yes stop_codon:yes gene_type:complete